MSAITAGNHLVAIVSAAKNPGQVTFTPPAGWTQAGTTLHNDVFISISTVVFYYENNPGGGTSFSFTLSGAVSAWHIDVMEYSGVATSASLDATTAREQDSTATPSSGAITTTAAGDLIIGWTDEDDNNGAYTLTYPSGYTALSGMPITDTNGWTSSYIAWKVGGSAGSENWNPTLSSGNPDGNYTIVAFKAAGGGGSSTNWSQSVTDAQSGRDVRLSQETKPLTSDKQSGTDSSVRQPSKVAVDKQSGSDSSVQNPTKVAADASSGTDFTGKTATKPMTDAQSGVDSVTKAIRAVKIDSQSATDALSHLWTAHLALSEAISGLDVTQKQVLHSVLGSISATDSLTESNESGGTAYTQSLTDNFSEDDLLAARILTKLLAETYSSVDELVKASYKGLLELVSGLDAVQKQTLHTFIDTGLSQTDLVTSTYFTGGSIFTQSLTDSFVEDDVLASKVLAKLVADALSAHDLRTSRVGKALYDVFSGSDALLKQVQRAITETVSGVDRLTAGKVLLLTLLDGASLLDSPMTTYTKAQFGLLSLITSLVASSLGMTITFTNSTALAASTILLAGALAMVISIPF